MTKDYYREGRKAYRKRYYAEHAELERARRKNYWKTHKKEESATAKAWLLKNKDKVRRARRERANSGKFRERRFRRPQSVRLAVQRWLSEISSRWCSRCWRVCGIDQFYKQTNGRVHCWCKSCFNRRPA